MSSTVSITGTPQAAAGAPSISTPAEIRQLLAEHIAAQSAAFHVQQQAALAARAGAQAAGTPVPEISQELFLEHLRLMQAHYTTGPGAVAARAVQPASASYAATPVHAAEHLYKLPPNLGTHLAIEPMLASAASGPVEKPATAAPKSAAGDKAVDDVIEHIHTESLTLIQQHSQELVSAAENAERTKMSTADFTKQMDGLRVRDKTAADTKLDQLYAKAAEVGKLHPQQRARLLAATNHGSNLFGTLFAGILSVGHTVEKGVIAAIHAVVSPVAKTVGVVAHWATSAISSVGKFLGSIF